MLLASWLAFHAFNMTLLSLLPPVQFFDVFSSG
jgi:hypothetical protein